MPSKSSISTDIENKKCIGRTAQARLPMQQPISLPMLSLKNLNYKLRYVECFGLIKFEIFLNLNDTSIRSSITLKYGIHYTVQ